MLLDDRSVLQMKSQAALLTNPNGQLTFNYKWDSALNFSKPFHFLLIGRKQSEFGITENSLWMAQTQKILWLGSSYFKDIFVYITRAVMH